MAYSNGHTAKLISESGLKVTQQRIVVYQWLLETTSHPTAEMVYDMVRSDNPSISKGTIYKTLETLVEVGLVKKIPTSGSNMRYDARQEDHSHICLSNTNEIIDYFDDDLQKMIEDHLKNKHLNNLKIQKFSLHIEGEKIDVKKRILTN